MDVAIGLVGCGRWGTNHHRILATLRTEGRIHRLVVCDIDASKTDGLEADAHYTSMEAMMANEQLHGVAIVTPPETHLSLAQQAFGNGAAVLMEKPLSENHEANQRFLSTVDDKVLVVGYILRHHPGLQKVRSPEVRKALGNITSVRYLRRTQRARPEGSTPVATLGVHGVDVIAWLLDRSLALATTRFSAQGPDESAATLSFSTGETGFFDVAWSAGEEVRIVEVEGDRGRARFDFGSGALKLELNEGTTRDVSVIPSEPLRAEWQYFLERCRSRDPTVFPSKQRLLDQSAWLDAHAHTEP